MAAVCDTIRAAHAAYLAANDPDLVVPPLERPPKMWWTCIIPMDKKPLATRVTRAAVVASLEPAADCVTCGKRSCLAQVPAYTLYQLALAAPNVGALFEVFNANGGFPWSTAAGLETVARWAMRGRADIVLTAREYGLDPFAVVSPLAWSYGPCSVVSLIAKKFVDTAWKFRSPILMGSVVSSTVFVVSSCSYDTTVFAELMAEARSLHPGLHEEDFALAVSALAKINVVV